MQNRKAIKRRIISRSLILYSSIWVAFVFIYIYMRLLHLKNQHTSDVIEKTRDKGMYFYETKKENHVPNGTSERGYIFKQTYTHWGRKENTLHRLHCRHSSSVYFTSSLLIWNLHVMTCTHGNFLHDNFSILRISNSNDALVLGANIWLKKDFVNIIFMQHVTHQNFKEIKLYTLYAIRKSRK